MFLSYSVDPWRNPFSWAEAYPFITPQFRSLKDIFSCSLNYENNSRWLRYDSVNYTIPFYYCLKFHTEKLKSLFEPHRKKINVVHVRTAKSKIRFRPGSVRPESSFSAWTINSPCWINENNNQDSDQPALMRRLS